MEKIQHDEPARVRSFHPQIPRDLEAIVQKCLEKDPRRRYQTADGSGRRPRAIFERGSRAGAPVGPLRRTFRQAKRRPARTASIVAAILAVPLLFLGYRYWDAHFRLKVEYYANFTKEFGAPRGIGPVSEAEARHRFVTWKFIKRGRQVESFEAVNGRGYPSVEHGVTAFIHRLNEGKRECKYAYKRNADGGLEEEIALDRRAKSSGSFTSARRRPVITPTSGAFPVPVAGRERPSWNSSSPTRVSRGRRISSTRTEIRRRVPRTSSASPANSTNGARKSNGDSWTRHTNRPSTARGLPASGSRTTNRETGSMRWLSERTGSRPFTRKGSRSGSANTIGTATSSRKRTWAPTTSRSSSRPVTPNGVASTTSRVTASPKVI